MLLLIQLQIVTAIVELRCMAVLSRSLVVGALCIVLRTCSRVVCSSGAVAVCSSYLRVRVRRDERRCCPQSRLRRAAVRRRQLKTVATSCLWGCTTVRGDLAVLVSRIELRSFLYSVPLLTRPGEMRIGSCGGGALQNVDRIDPFVP